MAGIVSVIWAAIETYSYRNDPYAISYHGTNQFEFWFPLTLVVILLYSWPIPIVFFIGRQLWKNYLKQKTS